MNDASNKSNSIPTIVLGGTGYVAGELLRLIAGHPNLKLAAAVSESQAGEAIKDVFPHLQHSFADHNYISREQLDGVLNGLGGQKVALFSAAPHGASAALIEGVLQAAEKADCDMTVVDASADFRFATNAAYESVYGHPHGAQSLLDQFASALPEHIANTDKPHVGQPGCFATAMLLGAVPLIDFGITDGVIHAFGITGSTGSGRSPLAATHHPLRHSNLYAYKPLAHRHAPEVMGITTAVTGQELDLRFIPHSGPFARGIHMTLQAELVKDIGAEEIKAKLREFYAGKPFVEVMDGMPRIKDVVGSNYAHIGVAVEGAAVAVFIVIDNLLKGAAGGCVQWMNIKLGLDETAGLLAPGPGWI
jgi:N-acetyl-gamma-glutamyl-phosphate reductase common form